MVVLVDDSAEVAADEDAPVADEGGQSLECLVREQVQVRSDDEAVAGEVAGGRGKVHCDAPVEEGPVPGLDDRRQVEELRRMVGAVEGPPVVPAEQEGDIGTGGRPGDLLERSELGSEPNRLAPAARLGPAVGKHRAVEFLGRRPRGAPLEEHDAVRRRAPVPGSAQSRNSPGRLGTLPHAS